MRNHHCYKRMPYVVCGEMLLGGYVLRPDFRTLYAIEQRLCMQLGTVVHALAEGALRPCDIRMILREGICATGERPPLFLPADADAAHHFLLTGMGIEHDRPMHVIAQEFLDWEALLMCATGVLGKSEETFWQMTYATLSLAAEGHAILHGVRFSNPPNRDELARMMQQFPDNIMHEEYP